jgi:hypothetical protein
MGASGDTSGLSMMWWVASTKNVKNDREIGGWSERCRYDWEQLIEHLRYMEPAASESH